MRLRSRHLLQYTYTYIPTRTLSYTRKCKLRIDKTGLRNDIFISFPMNRRSTIKSFSDCLLFFCECVIRRVPILETFSNAIFQLLNRRACRYRITFFTRTWNPEYAHWNIIYFCQEVRAMWWHSWIASPSHREIFSGVSRGNSKSMGDSRSHRTLGRVSV